MEHYTMATIIITVLLLVAWNFIFMYLPNRKPKRIAELKRHLAGLRAEWAMERQMMRNCERIFPGTVRELVRVIGELEEELRQLEGRPESDKPSELEL